MAKFVSPLLGYNNNVRHKNRVFHIQTEDSGINHPHIITHLFMDGGRILKSVKKSYAEHVGSEGMSETVRQMMKEQHKAMFIALRDGQFDHLVDPNAAPAKDKDAAPPTAPDPTPEGEVAAPVSPPVEIAPATVTDPPLAADAPPVAAAAEAPPVAPAAQAPRLVLVEPSADEVPATTRQPEPPAGAPALSLDLGPLEQPPADGSAESETLFRANDLPPPPKNLFNRERGTGTYRSLDAAPERDIGPAAKAPPAATPSKSPTPPRAAPQPQPQSQPRSGGEGARYAPARPAAIFGSSGKPQSQSIFSDDLVSDKSLDEVILSYLAEDLEPPRRK